MKPGKYYSKHLIWILLLHFIIANPSIYSQENLGRQTILRFDANHSVLKPDAPFLTESIPMEKGIFSASFVGGVGGISFDQVAIPADDLIISSLKLDYTINSEDGRRMELFINNMPVKVHLPDWLLVPIARYSNSPYYSCTTLFGKLNDKTLGKQVVDNKGRVINYHPSFDNTLLGIRLVYMDMLVGYSFTNDLPKNNEGKYILGKEETEPNTEANDLGAYYLSQYILSIENKYMIAFRSYVISDYTRQISFNVTSDSLIIKSFPYYFCWRFKSDDKNYDINKVAKEISGRYNQEILDLSKSDGTKTAQDWIIDKLISLAKKYKDNYSFYSEGTFLNVVKLESDTEKKQYLLKFTPESLFEAIIETEAYMDSYTVVNMKEFSDEISAKPEFFEAANPSVWNATVNTMRFAAFFRYVRTYYPETWLSFYNQINLVDPEPRIVTPTIMYDPAGKAMQNAVKTLK